MSEQFPAATEEGVQCSVFGVRGSETPPPEHRTPNPEHSPARRRSFVLVAVLVITASALLVATSLLFTIDANLAGRAQARDRTQMRMLAWSGVQAVASRLDAQRDRILEGGLPVLDREYVIYETGDLVGAVRLLPVTTDDEVLAPEAARLDLNRVDAEALVATGLVDETAAEAIIAHRDGALGGAFQSVAELLGVRGLDAEALYGPLAEITVADAAAGTERDVGERIADRLAGPEPRGLADVVTVYGIEPSIQRSGAKRINLDTPWSEELGRRVDRRFGPGSGAALRQIMDGGTSFASEGRIFQVLRFFDVDAQEWPQYADALTTESGDYHFGRVDINRAPVEALLALPGIGAEEAAQIVRARDGLSSEDQATIVWPLLREIVPPEAYDDLAGRITTRSWTYRVRIAASERRAGSGDDPAPAAPCIFEAVIDLCDPKARIAYLREVSHLQTAAILASRASFGPPDPESAVDEDDGAEGRENEERDDPGPAGLADAPEFPPAPGSDDPEDAFGGMRDQGRSTDENRLAEDVFDDRTADQERSADTSSRTAAGDVPAASDRAVDETDAGDAGDAGADRPRRVGRWRAGR